MFTADESEPVGEGASTAEAVVVDSFNMASEVSDMMGDVLFQESGRQLKVEVVRCLLDEWT